MEVDYEYTQLSDDGILEIEEKKRKTIEREKRDMAEYRKQQYKKKVIVW